ncbi:MAG: metal-binding protein [Actinobacteria bacterium]|nr:MAG: metal-binding protein [Actinomycetota bacterium]
MTNEPPRRHPRIARSLAVLAVAAVALGSTACGSDKKTSAGTGGKTTSGGATSGTVITIKDFKFSPDPLKAPAGATITIKNDDTTTHTVTADDKSFDSGEVANGTSGKITLPTKAATVKYHCQIHNFMKGSIEVTA